MEWSDSGQVETMTKVSDKAYDQELSKQIRFRKS